MMIKMQIGAAPTLLFRATYRTLRDTRCYICLGGKLVVNNNLKLPITEVGANPSHSIFVSARSARYYAIELCVCVRALNTQVD